MTFIATDTMNALRQRGEAQLPCYEQALRSACEASPPPFGEAWYGEKYRELSSDPGWLATSLIANAEKEGEGSRKLWELVARCPDPEIAEAIRQHAIDESRHAMQYVAMCELVFPGALEGDMKDYADGLSPRYSARDFPAPAPHASAQAVLDELVQMNIGEIRTRIHQLLMSPVITAYCPPERRERLHKLLASLMEDETRHIQYTARLINAAGEQGSADFVLHTTRRRVREFNELTLAEVGESMFTGE
ncbi:MAG: hypothetical protein K0R43_848 [Pseudoduganella sp.]|jgi:hypothetical protein|nr:hypothetical protein [Pseudoduganella sp.]